MIREAISKLVEGKDLSIDECHGAMAEIMNGQATPAQIASFLTALRMKGETPEEISGCALAMREKAIRVKVSVSPLVDTCGTGGDGAHTFNVSTLTALVAAAGGVYIAKHGNRSISSKCGSADLMEALGVKIDLGPEQVARCIEEVNIGFMFAPLFHPAMKYATPVRRELGIRTVFNILGPLCNPAGASIQLLGVFNMALTETLTKVLKLLGSQQALVVHSQGLDELSTLGGNKLTELKEGEIHTYYFEPSYLGFRKATLEELKVKDLSEGVKAAKEVLKGERGAKRDTVLLNSAAIFLLSNKVNDLKEGVELAAEIIDRGKAYKKLEEFASFTQKLAS